LVAYYKLFKICHVSGETICTFLQDVLFSMLLISANFLSFPVGKIAEKAVCRSVHNMALYFQCRINKNALFQTVFLATELEIP